MKIIAEKIVFGGNSLAKIDGKNVFVPFAIPGETLEVQITKNYKDYDVAEITSIISPSKHRVEPPCKYYKKCGGCNMLHIDYDFQKKLRTQILSDLFLQQGIDVQNQIEIISGQNYNYRCRFQLNNGGLSERSSNNIIPIEQCFCAEKKINEYLQNTSFDKRPKGRIPLFGSEFSENNVMIYQEKQSFQEKNTSYIKNGRKQKIKKNVHFAGTVYSPENSITVMLNGKNISFDVRGFFQSNLFVFEKVLNLIVQNLEGGKNILDMYAGCGSISAFLSDLYENVVLVEHNRDALVYAEQNLIGKKHTSFGMSGASWIKNCVSTCQPFDACVIDPPRSGMEKEVCDYLCNSNIKKIISLSCDPSTHARDCKKLIEAGYKIKKIYLLDFYPNTSHIESLVVFQK